MRGQGQAIEVAGSERKEHRRRRTWSAEEKRRIVGETEVPGASVSMVARRHDLNANLLFTWRRALRRDVVCTDAMAFVPALVTPEEPGFSPDTPRPGEGTAALKVGTASLAGRMEIVLLDGRRVIVDQEVSAAALARVIEVLERR
jgi:transposase